jgi:ATP-dependent Lon protease
MAERRSLPVLSTGTAVSFPGAPLTVAVTRAVSMRALDAAMRDDHVVFAVAELNGGEELKPEDLPTIGTLARVERVQMGRGALQATLLGQQRATALEYTPGEMLRAMVLPVQEIPPPDAEDTTLLALLRETRERAFDLGKVRGIDEDVLRRVLDSVREIGPFVDLVANYLDIGVREKQQLLETLAVEARLRRVLIQVQRQLELQKTQQDIHQQVQRELGERQREIFLREQLKAIQRELGESEERDDVGALREKLDALELPEEARNEVTRELGRLERSHGESMEAQVIRTYLQLISELPWNQRSEDTLELARAERVLDEDHFGLKDVKDRVLEFLAVRILNASRAGENPESTEGAPQCQRSRALARGPISLFVGPPGVGKTSIAQSIARALNRKYVRVSLGGVRDEADIRGHRRTYVAALPGRIIQGLRRAGTKNPVFLLDEVDKLGSSLQGDPASALLEVLDPAQNDAFTDHYLGVAFDLSEVLFIATGNFSHQIPAPLLDRMEVIEFAGYTEREKLEIARRYLVPRQLAQSGLPGGSDAFELTEEALLTVIGEYTRESGVRQLERQIGAVTRKLARRIASHEEVPRRVGSELTRALLGRARARPERAGKRDEVGVATGMYYTPAGGDIMFVEAAIRKLRAPPSPNAPVLELAGGSDVTLILTGQLGEVMRESARAALSYVMNHASELQMSNGPSSALEAHVHVPAGAVPKDGPSAGVTIATALASAFTRRPVRKEVAMTGEVTLSGHVLPIGGLKEKVLGAERAGVTEIILPQPNAQDIEELPDEVRARLRFHPVSSLTEVFAIALASTTAP